MALTETVTFRTSSKIKKRVEALAKKTHRSKSFYYNLLLEEYLENLEDIYLTDQVLADIRSGKQKTYSAEEVFKEA